MENKTPDKSADKEVGKKNKGVVYGKHATMPLLAEDLYAHVNIPDLKEFDPEELKLDATIVAVGKRRTGKSWCFRNLMFLMKDKIPAGIVISETDPLNKFWQQYVPKKFSLATI